MEQRGRDLPLEPSVLFLLAWVIQQRIKLEGFFAFASLQSIQTPFLPFSTARIQIPAVVGPLLSFPAVFGSLFAQFQVRSKVILNRHSPIIILASRGALPFPLAYFILLPLLPELQAAESENYNVILKLSLSYSQKVKKRFVEVWSIIACWLCHWLNLNQKTLCFGLGLGYLFRSFDGYSLGRRGVCRDNFRVGLGLEGCLRRMNMKPHPPLCGLLWLEDAWNGGTIDPHTSDRVLLIRTFLWRLVEDSPTSCPLRMPNRPSQIRQNDPRWMEISRPRPTPTHLSGQSFSSPKKDCPSPPSFFFILSIRRNPQI